MLSALRTRPTPGAAAALRVASCMLLLLQALPGAAQTLKPHPDARMQPTPAPESAPPAGTKAVPVPGGWMLEAPGSLQSPGGVTATSAARAQAGAQGTRFRTVITPSGAWMIEDSEVAVAAPVASRGLQTTQRTHAATGQVILEVPQSPTPTRPGPAGVRDVELRSAQDIARALIDPEPLVRYRVVGTGP